MDRKKLKTASSSLFSGYSEALHLILKAIPVFDSRYMVKRFFILMLLLLSVSFLFQGVNNRDIAKAEGVLNDGQCSPHGVFDGANVIPDIPDCNPENIDRTKLPWITSLTASETLTSHGDLNVGMEKYVDPKEGDINIGGADDAELRRSAGLFCREKSFTEYVTYLAEGSGSYKVASIDDLWVDGNSGSIITYLSCGKTSNVNVFGNLNITSLKGNGDRIILASPDGSIMTSSTYSGDSLGSHILSQNLQLQENWISRDSRNSGIYITSTENDIVLRSEGDKGTVINDLSVGLEYEKDPTRPDGRNIGTNGGLSVLNDTADNFCFETYGVGGGFKTYKTFVTSGDYTEYVTSAWQNQTGVFTKVYDLFCENVTSKIMMYPLKGSDTRMVVATSTGEISTSEIPMADNLGDHTLQENLVTNGKWISGSIGGSGIYVSSLDEVKLSNGLNVGVLAGTGTRMVVADESGTVSSQSIPAGPDNMGNHTATENIKTNGNWLSYNALNKGIYIDSSGGVKATSTVTIDSLSGTGTRMVATDATGKLSAQIMPYDNLGNHTMTTSLQTNDNWISYDGTMGKGVQFSSIGVPKFSSLAGTGTRMVLTSNTGQLSSRDTDSLVSNFKTNNLWLSGDGGDEGIMIDSTGGVILSKFIGQGDKMVVSDNSGNLSQADLPQYDFLHQDLNLNGYWLKGGGLSSPTKGMFVNESGGIYARSDVRVGVNRYLSPRKVDATLNMPLARVDTDLNATANKYCTENGFSNYTTYSYSTMVLDETYAYFDGSNWQYVAGDGNTGYNVISKIDCINDSSSIIVGALRDDLNGTTRMVVANASGQLGSAPIPTADHMGNHTALQNLIMGNFYVSGDGGDEGFRINSSGYAGLGIFDPVQLLHLHDISSGGKAFMQFTDTVTSGNLNSGFGIGLASGQIATLANYQSTETQINLIGGGDFRILNSGQSRQFVFIDNDTGNVGIGTDNPKTILEVNGVLKLTPRSSAVCNADAEGGIYYDSDINKLKLCTGSNWYNIRLE